MDLPLSHQMTSPPLMDAPPVEGKHCTPHANPGRLPGIESVCPVPRWRGGAPGRHTVHRLPRGEVEVALHLLEVERAVEVAARVLQEQVVEALRVAGGRARATLRPASREVSSAAFHSESCVFFLSDVNKSETSNRGSNRHVSPSEACTSNTARNEQHQIAPANQNSTMVLVIHLTWLKMFSEVQGSFLNVHMNFKNVKHFPKTQKLPKCKAWT